MRQTTLLSFFSEPISKASNIETLRDVQEALPETARPGAITKSDNNPQPTNILSQVKLQSFCTDDIAIFIVPHLPKAAIVKVQLSHLPQLKNITSTLLPVRYSDKFFNECIEDPIVAALSRVVLYDSKPVGWIRCRLEPKPGVNNLNQIYIQAIGVLAPFRGQGLASALLECIMQEEFCAQHNADTLYAHVWAANTDALEWYGRRGFKTVLLLQQYYKRLKPSSAWIVKKELTQSES